MSSIRARLVQANIERDNMLAAIADEEMYKEATRPYAHASVVERWNKRAARRALERKWGLQHSIPPGPWDNDLDNYLPGKEYTVDIGDGYEAVLNRNSSWMWRIYVRIPEDHPYVGRQYDDIPEMGVTYSVGNMFGFYLPESYTSSPCFFYSEYNNLEEFKTMYPRKYADYTRALEMAKELKEQFMEARKNPVAKVEREEEEIDPLEELLIGRFAEKAKVEEPKVEPKKPMSYKDALKGRK